jgi:tetratricopeptide (TPR) repeat protein
MPRVAAFAIALAALAAYANGLSGPFVFDDFATIVGNDSIRSLGPLSSLLQLPREVPTAGRPFVNATFAFNYAIGGLSVRGYHVANVLIHVLCALLVFGIVRRLMVAPPFSKWFGDCSLEVGFAVGLLWVLHPLNTEAVDYVTQRTESLMALFYLSSVYALLRARAGADRVWSAVAIGTCALGMTCKESMVTAPIAIFLCDCTVSQNSWRIVAQTRWRFYLALCSTWIILALLVGSGARSYTAGFSAGVSSWVYLLNQSVMIVHYLKLAIWPQSLVVNYGLPKTLALWAVTPYVVTVCALLGLTAWASIRRSPTALAGAWFFLTLAPTSSILPIATEVGAERRMYLPLVAVIVLAVSGAIVVWRWAANQAIDRVPTWSGVVAWTGLAAVALSYAAGTRARNLEYASSLILAETNLARWPSSAAHKMLGVELSAAGLHDQAIAQFRDANDYPTGQFHLAIELNSVGRGDEAATHFLRFIEDQRILSGVTGRPMTSEVGTACKELGRLYLSAGRWAEAEGQLQFLLTLTPGDREARELLTEAALQRGIEQASSGHGVDATESFRRATDADPSNAAAQMNLVLALLSFGGNPQEAVDHAQQAVSMRPNDPTALELRGRAFEYDQQWNRAQEDFLKAVELRPNYSLALQGLVRARSHVAAR